MNTEIEVMDKTIKCLALELHEVVWKDVAEKWNAVKLAAASTVLEATGIEKQIQSQYAEKGNQLSSIVGSIQEPLGEDAISFAEWVVSDNNAAPNKYNSDDDNNGKWCDAFSEGINRHYYTTEQLYQLYRKQSKQ